MLADREESLRSATSDTVLCFRTGARYEGGKRGEFIAANQRNGRVFRSDHVGPVVPPRRQADLCGTKEIVGVSSHKQAAMRFDPQFAQRKLIRLRLRFVVAGALGRYQPRKGNADAVHRNSAEPLGAVCYYAKRNALTMQSM